MVYISEFIPNPIGSDAGGEWLELWNSGDAIIDLDGWRVTTENGKTFLLSEHISAGEYLVIKRSESKLVLRNSDGGLRLYDIDGRLVDGVSFYGVAPEGKSFSRLGRGSGVNGQVFLFTEPTPSGENSLAGAVEVVKNEYPPSASLNASFGASEFIGAATGTALVLAGLILFIVIKNEDLQNLFFGKN